MRPTIHKIAKVLSDYPDISIATYQRSLVWKPTQKAQFVRSVLNQFPTGLIVINKTLRSPIGPLAVEAPGLVPEPVHDVIDGQQRLTTIKQFLENPLVYFTEWQKHAPVDDFVPEAEELVEVRDAFAKTMKLLGRRRQGFVPQGTSRTDLRSKVVSHALAHLRERATTRQVTDNRFKSLVEATDDLARAFGRAQVVIAELDDFEQDRAEEIYRVINTTGTPLLWWELLSVDHAFSRSPYPSTSGYRTRYEEDIRDISGRYRPPRKLRAQISTNDSFWSALLAVGERYQLGFAGQGPSVVSSFLDSSKRRLKVDGLGFRLVSGFLSHKISTVAVRDLFEDYTPEQIRQAIDVLFDTVSVLFNPAGAPSTGFALMLKYARFESGAIPAAPLMGVLLSAAKLIAFSSAQSGARTLTPRDSLKLRCLTEEIFRESLCTPKWAGSGDSKLKTWLDSHFECTRSRNEVNRGTNFPGGLLGANASYDDSEWTGFLDSLAPTNRPTVDRRSTFLHFWTQYLYDSRIPGCLPRGEVEFDHIVSAQDGPQTLTSHPLNYAAIDHALNSKKLNRSFDSWAPTGADLSAYKLQTLDSVHVQFGRAPGPGVDFLQYASHSSLEQMIDERRKVFRFAFTRLLSNWIDDGDR